MITVVVLRLHCRRGGRGKEEEPFRKQELVGLPGEERQEVCLGDPSTGSELLNLEVSKQGAPPCQGRLGHRGHQAAGSLTSHRLLPESRSF